MKKVEKIFFISISVLIILLGIIYKSLENRNYKQAHELFVKMKPTIEEIVKLNFYDVRKITFEGEVDPNFGDVKGYINDDPKLNFDVDVTSVENSVSLFSYSVHMKVKKNAPEFLDRIDK